MKSLTACALLAAQILPLGHAASAAELTEHRTQQIGAFAGLRVRMPLDGDIRQRQLRAGLAIAPTMHSRALNGESRLLIGDGLELGIRGRQPVRLMLAGRDVRRLGAAQHDGAQEEGDHGGPSTLGWIAIGAGALLLVTATVGYFVVDDIVDCDPGDDCS